MRRKKITREKLVIHEPVWDKAADDTQLPILLNWYNYNKSKDDAKKFFIQYLKNSGESSSVISSISRYDDIPLSNTIGWLCRIKTLGGELVPTKYDNKIELAKAQILSHVHTVENKIKPVSVKKSARPSVQEHINNQLGEYMGEIAFKIDEYLNSDGKKTFDMYEWLKSNEIKHQQAKNISENIYKYTLKELEETLEGSCEQLKEAYSFLTKPKLKKFIQFITDIIENCNKWSDVAKQISLNNRVPRIRKPKPPLKQVAKLKYLKESDSLKSVPATTIIGSKTLIVYNVKTKTLGMYVCNNAHGFSVKGSSILNFDAAESVCRKLRKPEEILPKVSTGGKIAIRKLMEDLTTKEKKLNGRINGDTLLLRAF